MAYDVLAIGRLRKISGPFFIAAVYGLALFHRQRSRWKEGPLLADRRQVDAPRSGFPTRPEERN